MTSEELRPWRRVARLGRRVGLVAAVAVLSCSEDTGVTPLSVQGTARVTGQLYLDTNGNGIFESGLDDPLSNVPVRLTFASTSAVVSQEPTDAGGLFDFQDVPVGTLRLEVDASFLADSLVARFERPDTFSVAPGDSLGFIVGVGAPERTISEIRSLPPGEQVFASGIALNNWLDLDGALHIENDSVFLRVTDVPAIDVGVGDSVRVSGRTTLLEGEIILASGQAFVQEQSARLVVPRTVTTDEARSARGASLDAALVEMNQVMVTETAAAPDGFVAVGDDGTGEVSIRIRESTGVELVEVPPGTVFPVVLGLLVPAGPGVWEVVPRSRNDASPPN